MRLEPEIWEALREICLRENKDLRELIRAVEGATSAGGRTSAVRVHVLQYFRAAATRDGHVQAGHGLSAGPAIVDLEDDACDGLTAPVHDMPPPLPAEDARTSLDA